LSGEGFREKPHLGQETSPGPDKEEPQQTSSDVEGRDDSNCEVELVGDDTEQGPQHSTHHQPSYCYLLLPFWNLLTQILLLLRVPVRIHEQGLRNIH